MGKEIRGVHRLITGSKEILVCFSARCNRENCCAAAGFFFLARICQCCSLVGMPSAFPDFSSGPLLAKAQILPTVEYISFFFSNDDKKSLRRVCSGWEVCCWLSGKTHNLITQLSNSTTVSALILTGWLPAHFLITAVM